MASIHKDPRSPFYIAMFKIRTPEGKWKNVRRSTKIHTSPPPGSSLSSSELMADALKVANLYERTAKGNTSIAHIRKVLAELSADAFQMPSINLFFSNQLAHIRKTKKPITARKYIDAVKIFLAHIPDQLNAPLDSITPQIIADFHTSLCSKFRKATTDSYLGYIRSILSAAVTLDILPSNPAEKILKNASATTQIDHDTQRRAFTLQELKTVLSAANPEWKSMILVSLYTGGQRLSDIATLRWDQVDFDKKLLTMRTFKRGKNLVIPLWSKLLNHLSALHSSSSSPFVHPHAAATFAKAGNRSSTLSNEFGHILFTCGLIPSDPKKAGKYYPKKDDKRRTKNPLSFHSLRYSATTFLHEAGVPPLIVQKIVGHDSAKIHEGYASFQLKNTAQALESLPDL